MTVYTKLLEAQLEVEGVAKGGRNEAQQYDFVRAVDVVKEGKRALNKVGLVATLAISSSGFTDTLKIIDRGGKTPVILYNVEGELVVTDPEDGSQVMLHVFGAGSSYGDEKGAYKAITGAWKYGIRTLLQIPDEKDDPEIETENDREVVRTGPVLATDAQKRMLRARGHDLGLDDSGFKALAFAATGKRTSKELTDKDVETILARFEDKEFVEFYGTATEVKEEVTA